MHGPHNLDCQRQSVARSPQAPVAALRVAPTGHLATHAPLNTSWVVLVHTEGLMEAVSKVGRQRRVDCTAMGRAKQAEG